MGEHATLAIVNNLQLVRWGDVGWEAWLRPLLILRSGAHLLSI
jgi:hypothetical protein